VSSISVHFLVALIAALSVLTIIFIIVSSKQKSRIHFLESFYSEQDQKLRDRITQSFHTETSLKEHIDEIKKEKVSAVASKESEMNTVINELKKKIGELQPYYDQFKDISDKEKLLVDFQTAIDVLRSSADKQLAILRNPVIREVPQEVQPSIQVVTQEEHPASKESQSILSNVKVLPESTNSLPCSYSYDNVTIVGTKYRNIDLGIINTGDEVSFNQEPENKYDNNAVKVMVGSNHIGYIARDSKLQSMINDWLASNLPLQALVSSVNKSDDRITIDLAFYGNRKKKSRYTMRKELKLIGNKNVEMQDNISICSEGDSVTFSYDAEKEKYEVLDDGHLLIGYLPSSAEKFVDEDYEAQITSIEYDDNGKSIVEVGISLLKVG
jgi:hypothetical protein